MCERCVFPSSRCVQNLQNGVTDTSTEKLTTHFQNCLPSEEWSITFNCLPDFECKNFGAYAKCDWMKGHPLANGYQRSKRSMFSHTEL
ncbi:hypothetical protein HDU92_000869 [Lobulomyces angularis]|nr:hypothetical protein HDU92_000869 [Lobulomyces angularis]